DKAIKIIVAAGSLNYHSKPIAIQNKMNVIKPETLEKIIHLQISYPNSINLSQLKFCLENEPFGEDANNKLLKFINKIEDEIKLRSEIVQLVKKHDKQIIAFLLGSYSALNPLKPLTERELYNILIELSSPLAGYLGRDKCNDNNWKNDRFYFLRDLNYPDTE
ncbi:MAG: hypothetical protein ACRC6M_15750, partial [Microcystaceae cyanobacterium]